MIEKKYECEVITPMFLHGADGRTPELRPPSIKGLIRFWWRVSTPKFNDEKLFLSEEERIFGGSHKNKKKSPVSLIIKKTPTKTSYVSPLPHKNNFKLKCFTTENNFSIKLLGSKDYINYFERSFKLLSFLGGLGKRVRRGFGSFEIIHEKDEINFLQKIYDQLDKNIYERSEDEIEYTGEKPFDYPFIERIRVIKNNKINDYNKILTIIGEATHKYGMKNIKNRSKRYASPIIVSVKRSQNNYLTTITELNKTHDSKNKSYNNFVDYIVKEVKSD